MKAHTNGFKENIRSLGRELNSIISYTVNGVDYELGNNMLNSVTPHYEGSILKSVMKQLDIDSNVEIPLETEINYQLGVKVDNDYEYLDFGNYIVYSVEKQEDTRSYKIVAYDKMLYSMKTYEQMSITYPITIHDYIAAICDHLNLTFKNEGETFVNYDKQIANELYIDEDGNVLEYTFRDVLDQLAEVTASTICINEDDELEIRYIDKNILPAEYTQVDYIQSTGTQWIDTDYKINDNCTAKFTYEYISGNAVSGVYNGGNSDLYIGIVRANTGNFNYRYGSVFYGDADVVTNTKYEIEVSLKRNNQSLKINGNVIATSTNSSVITNNRNCYIFSINNLTTVNNLVGKLYNFQIYNGEQLVRDFIPCYRNPDNEVGLYDIVNDVFYTNQGTGQFTYGNEKFDIIDERFLKDVNVNFGEKCGPINTIVFSRSAGSDKIALSNPVDLPDDEKIAIEISDNQIINFNNRDIFLQEILDQLYGLEYYINDFTSTGICYYDLCDKYNIQVGNVTYPCIMLNDEINITQGLQESIYCDALDGSDTDYTKVNKTDRAISQTNLIVDKQGRTIDGLVYDMHDVNGVVNENYTRITQSINQINTNIQTAGGVNLLLNSVMFAHNDDGIDNWTTSGQGTIDISDSPASVLAGGISGHVFVLNNLIAKQRINVKIDNDEIPEEEKVYYTFSTKIKKNINGTCYVKIYNNNEEHIININQGENPYFADYEINSLLPKDNYYDIEFYGSAGSDATFTDNMFTIGTYKKQWTQASGEIMNTQVNLGINGVNIKSSVNEGTETVITPFEFSGYSNVNGVRTKVFTLNGDTTEVEKIKVRKQISMPPLKIVPITTGSRQGWAFVPTEEGY